MLLSRSTIQNPFEPTRRKKKALHYVVFHLVIANQNPSREKKAEGPLSSLHSLLGIISPTFSFRILTYLALLIRKYPKIK